MNDRQSLEGTPRSRRTAVASQFIFLGVCAGILAWFPWADIWDRHFASAGPYLLYNIARLAYAVVLAVALAGVGRFALHIVAPGKRNALGDSSERLLLCFYVGAGVAIPVLFAVDAAALLHRWLMLPFFLAAAWAGFPTLVEAVAELRTVLRGRSASGARLLAYSALVVSLAVAWVFILLNSTLAVAGFDHDSAAHYLPYYQEVVANHGTRPNEYWYHFWVSKGAGLHFLSILLTDLEAPQVVSSVFVAFAVLAMYAGVRQASRSAAWGLAAAAVLSAGFISHFPYFQKDHIVTFGLVAGLLWAAGSEDLAREPALRRLVLSVLAVAAVVNAPPLAAVLVSVLGLMAALEWRCSPIRNAASALASVTPAVATGSAISIILAVNYLWTGLGEVTPFKLFLDFADQARLAHYYSPYLLLWADEGSRGTTGKLSLAEVTSVAVVLQRLHALLHLHALAPAVLSFLKLMVPFLVVAAAVWTPWRAIVARFVPALLLLLCSTALGFVVNQPGSLERFYSFAFYSVVLIAVGSIGAFIGVIEPRISDSGRGHLAATSLVLAIVIGTGSTLYWSAQWLREEGVALLRERAAFAAGRRTLEDAMLYSHWHRDRGGLPQRGLSEACDGLGKTIRSWRAAKPPRVWSISFLYETGCYVLPDVRMQLEFSVAFGRRWHRIVFGPADEAEADLRNIGVRYFYINLANFEITQPATHSSFVFGCLPYGPLFNPNSLSRRFRIVWRREEALLLTFAGDGRGTPIDESLVEAWRKKVFAVQGSLGDMPSMCARLANYYRAQGESWPVHIDPTLGRLRGWQ